MAFSFLRTGNRELRTVLRDLGQNCPGFGGGVLGICNGASYYYVRSSGGYGFGWGYYADLIVVSAAGGAHSWGHYS